MNFIFTLVLWVLLYLGCTVAKSFVSNQDWLTAFLTGQVVMAFTFIITFITGFFYQINVRKQAKELANKIKKLGKEVVLYEKKYDELKVYYKKYLAEDYPKLERELFEKISENNPKELIALLQSYPELKTSLVFNNMIDRIDKSIQQIINCKLNIDDKVEYLDNIKCDSWLLLKPHN